MGLYTSLVRPALFILPPETAHAASKWFLARRWLRAILTRLVSEDTDPRLAIEVAGLKLNSPVGLSAGYDNNCQFLDLFAKLGFGYAVGGTVLPKRRRGHPPQRLMRLPSEQSLINALGFPSHGIPAVTNNLERLSRRQRRQDPIVLSVSGLSEGDFLACHAAMEPLADAIELNISCPNTKELRVFHESGTFRSLLDRINAQRTKPVFVKIPPYSSESEREDVLALVRIARELDADGITAANTKLVPAPQLSKREGGLSGRALFEDTLRIVAEVRAEAGSKMAINACGGIYTGEDAFRAIMAGADTVQLLTGLIYRGPAVAKEINRGLAQQLREHKYASLTDLIAKRRGSADRTRLPNLIPAHSST